jgi:hypothetical protein
MSCTTTTITVRLIKSFQYKNYRNLVFHGIDLSAINLNQLAEMVAVKISGNPVLTRLFPAGFLDTFKLYYAPHAAKTNNPIINVGQDEKLVLVDWVKALKEVGLVEGCEISFFNWAEYEEYVKDPQALWE